MKRAGLGAGAAFLLTALLAAPAGAVYPENGMMDMETPLLGLEQGDIELSIDHRFLGEVFEDPLEDLFGADMGANIRLETRMMLSEGLDLGVSYVRFGSIWAASGGWNRAAGPAGLRAQAGLYSEEVAHDQRKSGGMLEVSAELLEPLEAPWRLQPAISAGYDTRREMVGLGLGCDLMLNDTYSLWGEYMPVVDGKEEETLENDSFSFGLTARTYGHQFMFSLGNCTGIGLRGTMAGADSANLRLGFRIRRLM